MDEVPESALLQLREKEWKQCWKITGVLFCCSMGYAVVRYHVYKGVVWSQLPVYTTNKAIAVTALLLLALSFSGGELARFFSYFQGWREKFSRKTGITAFFLAVVHGCFSLLLLQPGYYPQIFAEDQFNLAGNLSLVSAVASSFILAVLALISITTIKQELAPSFLKSLQQLAGWLFPLLFLHTLFISNLSWWVAPWPGSLPPISLLSALICSAVVFLRVVGKLQKNFRKTIDN